MTTAPVLLAEMIKKAKGVAGRGPAAGEHVTGAVAALSALRAIAIVDRVALQAGQICALSSGLSASCREGVGNACRRIVRERLHAEVRSFKPWMS